MKFELWLLGKNDPYITHGLSLFTERLNRYLPFEVRVFQDAKKSNLPAAIKEAEGRLVMSKLDEKDYLVVLDERGREFTSEKFAAFVNTLLLSGKKKTVFLIGGAYGFDETVKKRADAVVSLSKMTYSHQVVRLLFAEQLYRAFTILKNEPYHHA